MPGTTTQRVSIPANFAGGPITVQDYLAAPAPVGGLGPNRQGAVSYSKDRSAFLRLAYEVNDLLTLTVNMRAGSRELRDNGNWRRVENVTIPAGYAGNPFGVPVRLSKIFFDLPPIYSGSETENYEVNFTAEGKLPGTWSYDASLTFLQGTSKMSPTLLDGANGQIGFQVAPAALFTSRLNAEIAAGRNPILIYDSNTQSPNTANALDPFFVNSTQTRLNDRVRTWTFNAQSNGVVFSLPGGDVRALIGVEGRTERVAFPGSVGGQVWPDLPKRDVAAVFTEVRVPIIGAEQDIPGVYGLEFNFAGRMEKYSDFGTATTPRYGLAWRPIRSLLLRGSYSEGFLAPQLYRIAEQTVPFTLPPFFVNTIFAGQVDFSRGNELVTNAGTLVQITGGNPDLQPQRSEHTSFGVVMDVPFVNGLSVSFDYYENDFSDAFGNISSMQDRQVYAPETIIRGERLPGDPADWLGPITGYDGRTINIASSRSAGFSYGVRYQRRTGWGDISLNLAGERTLRRQERIFPGADLTPSVNERFVADRITLNAMWAKGPWEAGVTGVYGGPYWANTTAPEKTGSVNRWDISGAFDFSQLQGFGKQGDSFWKRALHNTKLRVTIINVFDTEPTLNPNGTFSSSVIDMRLRRYVIDLSKNF